MNAEREKRDKCIKKKKKQPPLSRGRQNNITHTHVYIYIIKSSFVAARCDIMVPRRRPGTAHCVCAYIYIYDTSFVLCYILYRYILYYRHLFIAIHRYNTHRFVMLYRRCAYMC